MSPRGEETEVVLEVNPIECDAHGLCAELFPERITLDDWGYPIVDDRPIRPGEAGHAQRAVEACPTVALMLRVRARQRA